MAKAVFKQSDISRGIQAAVSAGQQLASYRIAPDGSLEFQLVTTQTPKDDFERWEAEND